MGIPIAIDFSKIYSEKVLFSETLQYQILKSMKESEWKKYKSEMLKENVTVSYDATTDTFLAKPLKQLKTLTESRNSGNLEFANNVVSLKPKLHEDGFDTNGNPYGFPPPNEDEECSYCDGGIKDTGEECEHCDGTGYAKDDYNLNESEGEEQDCLTCDGEGRFSDGSSCPTCFGSGVEVVFNDSRIDESKKRFLRESIGVEEDDDDFDSSIDELLNGLDSEDEEEEFEEEEEEEVEDARPVDSALDVEELTSKLEQLINNILDTRATTAKDSFKQISGGELNSSLGEFGTEEVLGVDRTESEILNSEFGENQDRVDNIKARLENEVTYQDYLNGDMDNSSIETAGLLASEFDDEEEEDAYSARTDDFEGEAGGYSDMDNEFSRNAALSGNDIEIGSEELLDNKILPELADELTEGQLRSLKSQIAKKNMKLLKVNKLKEGLELTIGCNNKKYKINYKDVSVKRGQIPFSIKSEKFTTLDEALTRINGINRKTLTEKENFKKLTGDISNRSLGGNERGATILEGYEKVQDTKGWNVKAIGSISLKTGINETLSNITTKNPYDTNTLVKTTGNQYFLLKGNLNERSKIGVKKELVDMDRKCEYGTAEVVGIYKNNLKGMGQIMEKIQRTSVPLLIWK